MIEIQKTLVTMAETYGYELTKQQLEIWTKILMQEPTDKIIGACFEIMSDPEVTRMPLPAVILSRARNDVNANDEAVDIAALILDSISRYGWTNAHRAIEKIGEVGWAVVERIGGWQTLCETLTENNRGQLFAQLRDLTKATIGKSKRGQNQALTFDDISHKTQAKALNLNLKQIPKW